MTLPRALYGYQGPGQKVDVYTDTPIHDSALDAAAGRDMLKRVPSEAKFVVLDAENADEGERGKRYVARLNAANRDLQQPVSAYSNIRTDPYWARRAQMIDLARRGAPGIPKIGDYVPTPTEMAKSLAKPEQLAASKWAVFGAYPIDDATETWDDVAVIYQMAAVCRSVTSKPVVCYISPRLSRNADMSDAGVFVTPERWAAICAACVDACDSTVFYGFSGDIPAKDVQPFWEVLKAAAK